MGELFLLNVFVDIAGIIISAAGIIMALFYSANRRYENSHFFWFFVLLLLYALFHFFGLYYREKPGSINHIILVISFFWVYVLPPLLAYVTTYYLVNRCRIPYATRFKRTQMLIIDIHILMVLISQFNGMYYYVDQNNFYHHGHLYPLAYAGTLLIIIMDEAILIKYRDRLSHKEVIALSFFLLAPLASIIIQMFFPGIYFLAFTSVVAGIVMYIFILIDQQDRYNQQKVENAQIKASLLLGQMQPHFIFNSLMSIQDLCYSDPKMAARSIEDFAVYLRKNMETIAKQEMVSFDKELEFINEYIKLEKADKDRVFEVEYDLKVRNFLIPTLTLQPIVENAINHGALSRHDHQGKVIISSEELHDRIIVRVRDNGILSVSKTSDQIRHWGIALENIRKRIDYYCNGEVNLVSDENGTTVDIIIPKEGGKNAHDNR